MRTTRSLALALPFLAVLAGAVTHRDELLPIGYHDNQTPAGRDRDGVREVSFEIRRGLWQPNGPDRPGTPMMAFAEPGKPLRLPGPLIRVSAGTTLSITVHNATDSTIILRGLTAEPADSLVLTPGATGTARSVADRAGSRFYFGTFMGRTMRDRRAEDGHLAGAIIVDSPGTARREAILLITASYHSSDSLGRLTSAREIFAVNGRPWPFTERLQGKVGDSLHYRWLNATRDVHPIHLHGTFYRVEAQGGAWRDTALAPADSRMETTELLQPGETMAMSWRPDRPGEWLMHCHLTFHVLANIGFGADSLTNAQRGEMLQRGHDGDPAHHVEQGMGGLLMAIEVPAPLGWSLPRTPRKEITLEIPRDSADGEPLPAFAPTIRDGGAVSRPLSRVGPGGMLLLHQDEPTTVRVLNRSLDHTAIHWHGMELESLFDGVVGLGGVAQERTPAIAPGGTFEVHMTPPRAGTFIYHTHMMEVRQQERGLWGAMIVLPAGAAWDEARDHVFIVGTSSRSGPILNGAKVAPTLEFEAGVTHRLRLINITTGSPGLRYVLARPDSSVLEWRRHAKDAVDLPEARRVMVPARQVVSMGETYDMLFTPSEPAEYRLEIRNAAGVLLAQQPIRVVPRRP